MRHPQYWKGFSSAVGRFLDGKMGQQESQWRVQPYITTIRNISVMVSILKDPSMNQASSLGHDIRARCWPKVLPSSSPTLAKNFRLSSSQSSDTPRSYTSTDLISNTSASTSPPQSVMVHINPQIDGSTKSKPASNDFVCACPYSCGAVFRGSPANRRGNLNRHMKNCVEQGKEQRHRCPKCYETFSRSDGLKVHSRRFHTFLAWPFPPSIMQI